MGKYWKLKPEVSPDELKDLQDYHPLVARLLHRLGVRDKTLAEEFLNPRYERLHSPFLFRDLKKAVVRIWLALENRETICVYGDYDADAITANAVLRQTLKQLNAAAFSYIPDRFSEGYGVNLEALQKIKEQGAKLIITVDCGTNSTDAAEFCQKNGMDLIVTDHHEVIGPPPKVCALINPKNPEDNYPYKEITDAGVAFKLACGILSEREKVQSRLGQPLSPALDARAGHSPLIRGEQKGKGYGWEKWLLDLVAIGTVADCHSLLGENRILVKYGLKVLQKTKWVGLKALIATAGLDFRQKPPNAYTLGFVIAPRLNAAGRLQHADMALKLLLEEDFKAATEQAAALEQINRKRQNLTARVFSEAKEQALGIAHRKVLVLWSRQWHRGIVGLVAGKLAEEFNKPVIVLEKGQEQSLGSARTAGEFDLIAGLKYVSEYLLKFGGHKQAAGLTLQNANFEIFYQKLLEFAEQALPQESQAAVLTVDAELQHKDFTPEVYDVLSAFEPHGVDNPKPLFKVAGMKLDSFRPAGAEATHLQLRLRAGEKTISAIWFNGGDFAKILKVGDTIDAVVELLQDSWNGNKTVKLKIVDLKII